MGGSSGGASGSDYFGSLTPAQIAALSQEGNAAAAQAQQAQYSNPQQAAFAAQGGGLMSQGAGQPLTYVPAAARSQAAGQTPADPYAQMAQPTPTSDNGQGLMNGPTSAAGTNPYSSLTPQQQALYALQAQSGQTTGGLMVGPNHTLVQAPPPQPVQITGAQGGAVDTAALAQQSTSGNGQGNT